MFLRSREGEETQRAFTRRALLLGGAQAAGFGLLGARLYQLQVMEGGLYAPLADRNRLSEYALAPLRGRILDSKGRVLADTVESFLELLAGGGVAHHALGALAQVEFANAGQGHGTAAGHFAGDHAADCIKRRTGRFLVAAHFLRQSRHELGLGHRFCHFLVSPRFCPAIGPHWAH